MTKISDLAGMDRQEIEAIGRRAGGMAVKRSVGRPRVERCAKGHSMADAYERDNGQRECRSCSLLRKHAFSGGIGATAAWDLFSRHLTFDCEDRKACLICWAFGQVDGKRARKLQRKFPYQQKLFGGAA